MPRVLNELREEDFESLVYHTKAIVKNFEKKYDKEMVRMAFETALNEAKKKNESEQRVDTLQGFADSLDLTRDHIGLIMDELDTDDADETFPVKELGNAMQRAKAKIGEDAWYMMFDDDPIYESVLNENGLGGSEFVDDELDEFLMDVAQMFGTIDYGQAIDFEKTITDEMDKRLLKLKQLYTEWMEAGELEDENELENIAIAVAKLVNGSWKLKENFGFNVSGKEGKEYLDEEVNFIKALADAIPVEFPGYTAEFHEKSMRLYVYGPGINPKQMSTGFGDELLPKELNDYIKKECADAGLEIGGFLGVSNDDERSAFQKKWAETHPKIEPPKSLRSPDKRLKNWEEKYAAKKAKYDADLKAYNDERSKRDKEYYANIPGSYKKDAISMDFQTAGYTKRAQAFYDSLRYKGD